MEIKPEDISISEWRSVPKGSHSASPVMGIRIVHIPTGAMVCCDTERSQHKNKALAMAKLRTKLKEIPMTPKMLRELYGESGEHPRYLIAHWRDQVFSQITLEGYWDWVAALVVKYG
jgi:hypothetical protein